MTLLRRLQKNLTRTSLAAICKLFITAYLDYKELQRMTKRLMTPFNKRL